MKKNIKNTIIKNNQFAIPNLFRNLSIFLFTTALILSYISCSNSTQNPKSEENPSVIVQESTKGQGIATVKMFVPDYYTLAEQSVARAIAPQSVSARLCYLVNGSWVGINTVNLSDATKTPVENAPEGFTGSVYTLSFAGVPIGSYAASNLKIELLDSTGTSITSGTNTSSVTITKGGSASTTFYTIPESSTANSGNLAAGEMKFTRAALVKGVTYSLVIASSGDYPDLVLFGNNGKLIKYIPVDSEAAATVSLTVDSTDVYYLGLWADDGNAIARYTLNFDYGTGTQLSSVLTGTNLHWTKENSPYFVNANILVEEGKELTIDPGVIVQFTGNYYLKVTGTISAVGTKAEPIIFVQSGDNLSNWAGITIDSTTPMNVTNTYNYSSGNILKNCMVIGASTPLLLNSATYVDSCTFTGNGNYVSAGSNSLLINNVMDDGVYASGSSRIINNNIKRKVDCCSSSSFMNNTIADANLWFYSGSRYAGIFSANTVKACSISIDCYSLITGNNFLGYNDVILNASNCSYASYKSFNFTGNYWGEAQTSEIEAKCGSNVADSDKDYNMSFFTDYYDNFENTKIDFSNWATEPIEGAGYLGEGFITFDYTINGYNFNSSSYYPESTSPELSIVVNPQYHANDIASVRIAQSLAGLKEKAWSAYSANQSFTVDKTSLVDGFATIFVQIKDSKGNVSSPVIHEVPFDSPVVTLSIADGTEYSNATSSVTLNYSATDNCNITPYVLYVDGYKVSSYEASYGWGKSYSNSYTLGLSYMASGNHTIKATFWDSAGNKTSKEITFTINRNVNTSAYVGTTFNATTGQLLKDTNTIYLWHLDSDGKEVTGDDSATIAEYTAGTGGLGGYASYLYQNDNKIPLILENAFTVEFWRKDNNSINISKSNVFSFGSDSFYRGYTTAGGSSSYNSISWSNPSDNDWHFWSFVYGETYMAVYRDGILISYQDGLTQTLNINDNKLYIEGYNIDELRISSVARSADEIAAYYAVAKDKIQ